MPAVLMPPEGYYVAKIVAVELKTSKKSGKIYTSITVDIPTLPLEQRTQTLTRLGNVAMEWSFIRQHNVLLGINVSHRQYEDQSYVAITLRKITQGCNS